MAAGSAETKGRRLAELIGQRRALLILDGLEPLQYPPTSPRAGQLRDAGVAALLTGLASHNPGLCVVTTRIAIQDLIGVREAAVRPLARLSTEAGVVLLRALGVVGSAKLMADLVDEVQGHALTLTLLGSFLKRAHRGAIERRDRIRWQKADSTEQDGHAFRAMEAYENWFLQGGEEGAREVAILRLMGLFDRPADAGSIEVLCSEIIPGLNEPLVKLDEDDWSSSLATLENSHLLTVNRDDSGQLISVDAHPLLREYFAAKIPPATRELAQNLLLGGGDHLERRADRKSGDSRQNKPVSERSMEMESLPKTARDLVYISYSNTDKQWREIIHNVLESDPEIRDLLWDDTAIPPGKELAQEITDHLARAKVIIMITSPAYWRPNSGAVSFEVTPALKAHTRQELDILWIPVKGYRFETSPVGHIMAATGPGAIPLENLRGEERESALLRLLAAVRRCLHLPVATSSTQEKSGTSQESGEPLKSGLSLSGGGFRATFFHLGILAFHFRRGSLKDLKVITAVSGGAILAAHAVLHWETLIRDEEGFREVMAKLVTLARSNVRNKILVRWLWCLGTLWRFVGRAATRLSKSRTGRLVREYRTFYGRRALKDLDRPGRPWLALVATDLSNSSRVYFSQDGMRRLSIANNAREEPFPQKVELDVAFAVAASSSFPPIFRPLVLDYKVLRVRWDEFKLEMRLQDGGVHDNLGLRALQLITPAVDIVLGVIHASYVVNPDHIHKPGTGVFSDLRRALQIFTRGESAEIANDIATLAGAKAVITRLSDRVPADQPHLLETDTQTCLMSFRTDLDSPNWSEMYALMSHGYRVAAMRSQHLDAGDLDAARALFCAILAAGLAQENGSTPTLEMPKIDKMVSELSAEQLQRCGMRPKRRVLFHLLLYFSLLSALLFSVFEYKKPIATWIQQFLRSDEGRITVMKPEANAAPPIGDSSIEHILNLAAGSPMARYEWPNHGVAPIGYTKGMAAAYALVYCNWRLGSDSGALEMARAARKDNPDTDALSWLDDQFAAAGMHNDVDGAGTLRHLLVLLTSLGMQESSGRYCAGRGVSSVLSNAASTAEAGLFQANYQAVWAIPGYESLFATYVDSSALRNIFQEGVSPTKNDLENVGSGPGFDFQVLSKRCPAFAVEFTALGARKIRSHWSSINNRQVDIRPECDEMFLQVQTLIDKVTNGDSAKLRRMRSLLLGTPSEFPWPAG